MVTFHNHASPPTTPIAAAACASAATNAPATIHLRTRRAMAQAGVATA